MSQKPRGVFINTAKATCSIHESGRMVFACLELCEAVNLDYYSLDMLDVDVLSATGRLVLKPGIAGVPPRDAYDFWVFNWHFITMAMHLEPGVIARIQQPKFTVVLELAPGDPLQLVPPNVFDAYIALDPGATKSGAIYPFPRPLDGLPRRQDAPPRDVPMIGSFGFPTPGKGFDVVVGAVNAEFERAIVRINVPTGEFVSTDKIHRRNYSRYLEDYCQRIAKPGIEVRFSFDFMSPDELVDWCAENDLNCFMYNRAQPGLSATTDQAIIAGRPLVTSSNDTFRHIHQYIPPYPLTSLRAALRESRAGVEAMQRDWSREAFNRRFSSMLSDFGVLDRSVVSATVESAEFAAPMRVLVASPGLAAKGLYERTNRATAALARTGAFDVRTVDVGDADALAAAVAEDTPDVLLLADPRNLLGAPDTASVPTVWLTDDLVAASTPVGGKQISLQPIIPYQTVTSELNEVTTVWLLGFAADEPVLQDALRRIVQELPGARVYVQMVPGMTSAARARAGQIVSDMTGIDASVEPIPATGEVAIALYAQAHLILARNDVGHADHLQNLAELAMITERAVATSAVAPFPALQETVTSYEQHSLPTLIAMGAQAQIGALLAFGEGVTYARLHAALTPLAKGQAGARVALAADSPERQVAQAHVETVRVLYQELLGRGPDPIGLQHYVSKLEQGISRKRIARDIGRSSEALAYRAQRAAPAGGVRSVADLLQLHGEPFVRATYKVLLGRDADPMGLAHHLGLLEDGESRAAVILGLYHSTEGQAFASALPGLAELVRKGLGRGTFARWLGKRNRAARFDRRLLNVLDHRVGKLQDALSDLEARPAPIVVEVHGAPVASVVQPAADAVGPPPSASPVDAPVAVVPPHPGGAVYVLGSLGGGVDAAVVGQEITTNIGVRPVRGVQWNASAKRLEIAAPQGVPERCDGALSPSDGATAVLRLEQTSIGANDLLLVFGPASADPYADNMLETNIILECRRLGLTNAFVVDDAAVERRGSSARDEHCLQSLLLADCLIATSESALHELEVFFTLAQRATYAPPRAAMARVPSPSVDITLIEAAADVAASVLQEAYAVDVTLVMDGSVDRTMSFAAGLEASGVTVRQIKLDRKGLSHLVDSASDATSPRWVLIECGIDMADLRDLLTAASTANIRVALLASDGARIARLFAAPDVAEVIPCIEAILCTSAAIVDQVWKAMLAHRVHYPTASSRIVPLDGANARVERLASRIATALARHVPQAGRKTLSVPRKGANEVRRPLLSICISTYNRAGWLRASLENIARQLPDPRADIEVLVVDNTSLDDTPSVCAGFSHRPDFRFIRNRVNVGMLGNLAVTAQHARGDYIWILGDDDLTRDGAIDKVVDVLHRHPAVELVYMNYGYTTEADPANVEDYSTFLNGFNVLQEAGPDELGTVASIAAKTENFYTAIYSHVYRRDHALRAYCQDTSGRTFATMRSCIPTTAYVLSEMAAAPAYWIGEQMLVVNSNVSWAAYGPMLDLEHLPESWDMAERIGCPQKEVDQRRANRLWLVELMWRQLFEDDKVGNSSYISAERVLLRLQHLDEFAPFVPALRAVYETAHLAGNPAARMAPADLFAAFAKAEG